MVDVQLTNGSIVMFQKKLWHESEIVLAKCFNFNVNIDSGIIMADIRITSKRALYGFISVSFKNFSESVMEHDRREAFYSAVESIYAQLNGEVNNIITNYLPYHAMMYQHQKDVIMESFRRKYNFYALDMGLGKTLTSASLSRVHQISRTVIFCPAAVKWNWFRDLTQKFGFNELYFTILDATKRRNVKALQERFVIVNYDIAGKMIKEITNGYIGHFIFDEAHLLKNHNSLRYKNVKKIVDMYPDAYITFLSGTPVKNRVNDVFGYLKMIGHELGQSYKKFTDEYTIKVNARGGEKVTGGKNLQDLFIKLSNFMIRKTKEECLDLPDKIFLNYRYEMDDYREEYNKIIEELSQIKELSSLTGNLHSLNIITAKAKIKGIIEIAEEIIESGNKVVIFSSYKEPLRMLEDYFKERCVKIDGSVDSWTRDQHVQKFIEDDNCHVFLGNMIAAGVGINLVNASDVIFVNFPFTPSELYQAIDRCHRIGQSKSVNVHYTFCDESIDEYIYDIIIDKEHDINALIDQGKEVNLRENFTEVLMKKLLNRNVEIINDLPISEVDGATSQEQVEETNVVAVDMPPELHKEEPKVITDEEVKRNWDHVASNKLQPPTFM